MKNLFTLILLITGFYSCISPYEFNLNDNPAFLLIDGQIYDKDSCVIRLYYTNQKNNDPVNTPIAEAKVFLLENGKTIIPFMYEKSSEKYKPQDLRFRGCENCTYKLNIVLPNGKEYESSTDTIKMPDAYEKISDSYNSAKKKFEVFGELKSKGKEVRYYQTYFINYERCKFCDDCNRCCGHEFVPNYPCPGLLKSCNPEPRGSTQSLDNQFNYGFRCDITNPKSYNCWNFKRQRYYSIFADNILPIGSNRVQKLLEVPLSDYTRYYIEVYQNTITSDAYRYMKSLQENGQRTGTLTDPTPPIITGNVFLKGDDNKKALGFFQVSGQQKYGYYVERAKVPLGEVNVPENIDLIYYDVRPYKLIEAPGLPGCAGTPQALCKLSSFRTNVKPLNWRD